MSDASAVIRRGRRTDFSATMHLLASCGLPVPPPDRATLRRFRAIVADLGADFYVALVDGTVAGVVHLTYSRRLATRARAHLDLLLVTPAHRRVGVGTALLRFARKRAEKRDCAYLVHDLDSPDPIAESLLTRHGLNAAATTWVASIGGPAAAESAHG